jgi:hypothetical protein
VRMYHDSSHDSLPYGAWSVAGLTGCGRRPSIVRIVVTIRGSLALAAPAIGTQLASRVRDMRDLDVASATLVKQKRLPRVAMARAATAHVAACSRRSTRPFVGSLEDALWFWFLSPLGIGH